jgi:hypothetical protein
MARSESAKAAVSTTSTASRKVTRAAGPVLDTYGGAEHRAFPRAILSVPVSLWIGEGEQRKFSATLSTSNVSVNGAFVSSTFFLPVGSVLNVRFSLEPDAEPIEAQAEIVREERNGERGGRSGFGLRFLEFFNQTEVSLARLFLGGQLFGFAESYLQSRRSRALSSELERVVDALAAWELLKATHPEEAWGLRSTPES